MNKQEFISAADSELKALGYRRNRNYWYKASLNFLICLNIQGSQWDKNDYYVEIGLSSLREEQKFPPILDWDIRHRCTGVNGERNISPEDFMTELRNLCSQLNTVNSLTELIEKSNAVRIVNQYLF